MFWWCDASVGKTAAAIVCATVAPWQRNLEFMSCFSVREIFGHACVAVWATFTLWSTRQYAYRRLLFVTQHKQPHNSVNQEFDQNTREATLLLVERDMRDC